MNNQPIGVFDSGLGGLSVVKELNHLLPNEDIVYFGDTARVPYGTRDFNTITRYAMQDIQFLQKHNVKLIVAACGTVSSIASIFRNNINVPFVTILENAALMAAKASCIKRVGIIGTMATIKSQSFTHILRNIDNNIKTFSMPCSLLIPLVEEGWIDYDNSIMRAVLKKYLTPLSQENIDVLILGCTHFPIIAPIISDVIGKNVTLINTGESVAYDVAEILQNQNLLTQKVSVGYTKCYVSDYSENFDNIAHIFMSKKLDIERVDMWN